MQADLEKESFKQTKKKLSPKKGNKNLKKATISYQKFKYFRSITEGKREILSFSEKKMSTTDQKSCVTFKETYAIFVKRMLCLIFK